MKSWQSVYICPEGVQCLILGNISSMFVYIMVRLLACCRLYRLDRPHDTRHIMMSDNIDLCPREPTLNLWLGAKVIDKLSNDVHW